MKWHDWENISMISDQDDSVTRQMAREKVIEESRYKRLVTILPGIDVWDW